MKFAVLLFVCLVKVALSDPVPTDVVVPDIVVPETPPEVSGPETRNFDEISPLSQDPPPVGAPVDVVPDGPEEVPDDNNSDDKNPEDPQEELPSHDVVVPDIVVPETPPETSDPETENSQEIIPQSSDGHDEVPGDNETDNSDDKTSENPPIEPIDSNELILGEPEEPSDGADNSTVRLVRLLIFPEKIARTILMQNVSREGRIVYGNLATTNQCPYFAYLVIYRSASSTFCGGTLVHAGWVITAAHCMKDCTGVQVYMGSNDKQNMRTTQSAYAYAIHPNYNPNTIANDIAIIKLQYSVALSAAVQPVQMPPLSSMTRDYTGITLLVSGFGETVTGAYPRYLYYTYLRGVSDATCRSLWWMYISSMICANGLSSGSSICFGDSGGPLVLENPGGVATFIGVNSYVEKTPCTNSYQGFTRVDYYLQWISTYTGAQISP